ncbi:hypothetical protein [Streptosporangium carneum]|uniref:hypothetical protein n=1 Tax=Streptosporangium carneum TaxID=47481 RepID=UPI0022F2C240|nr:hypothetical protein [Streptosporangium carneum]
MTPPILGQRSRGELITELYDNHAAGLFAYCHDQLGDPDSAAAVLTAVFATVSPTESQDAAEPPRAALYALARREIQHRDVVYAPPAPGADPVPAFVERVLRDLRPHQREVLYLSGVCEMDVSELSWVLDVAADTADELTVSACRRFSQSLELALTSARVPAHLADAFGALGIAPIRDVLVRAPWAPLPAALRVATLGAMPEAASAPRAGTTAVPRSPSAEGAPSTSLTPLKPLWPTSPAWPLPLAETDALTNTSVFSPPDLPPPFSPADFFPVSSPQDRFPDPFSPPDQDAVSAHEATTEPMPKLKDSVLSALDEIVPRSPRRKLQRPKPRRAKPLSAPLPADVLDDAPRTEDALPGDDSSSPSASSGDDVFRPFTPEPRPARPHTDKLVASAPRGDILDPETPLPGWPLQADELDAASSDSWEPRAARPAPPDWPLPADELGAVPGDRARHAKRPRAEQTEPESATASGSAGPGPRGPGAVGPGLEGLTTWLTEAPRAADDPQDGAIHDTAAQDTVIQGPGAGVSETGEAGTAGKKRTGLATKAARPSRTSGRARRRHRPAKKGEQHHDWAWELFGFIICVICVAIAMLVFFAVPTIVTP